MTKLLEDQSLDIRLRTTPQLLALFDQYLPEHAYQESFPSSVLSNNKLPLSDLKALLCGSALHYPKKPVKEVNLAHEAYMTRLRQQMEEKEYQSMVAQDPGSSLAETSNDLRALKNQLSTIVNVFISIFTAAMASWFWTPHWTTGSRVLGSLMAAIGLGAIESFLYLRYLQKIEEGNKYEAGKKGKSVVIKSGASSSTNTTEKDDSLLIG